MGLEIAPKVRFMKKGQKQEEEEQPSTTNGETKAAGESSDRFSHEVIGEDEDDDEGWFTVKEKPEALEEISIDLPEKQDKYKKLTKAQLARKLRKKQLQINKRVEYDDEGKVSLNIVYLRKHRHLIFRSLCTRMMKINQPRTISKKLKLVFKKWIEKIKKLIEH